MVGMTREEVQAIERQLEKSEAAKAREQSGVSRMPNTDTVDMLKQDLSDAFPEGIDPMFDPFGTRVLVQMRRPQGKTRGGIELAGVTQADIAWNQQIAKVIALGPLCFRNRETRDPWPEGDWATVGDFVRVPRWNGDRIVVEDPNGGPAITFVTFNDHELLGRVRGDPLAMKVYIL